MILIALKLAAYAGLIGLAATAEGPARFALVGFFSADFFVWVVMALVDLPFAGVSALIELTIYLALIAVLGSSSPALMAAPETNDEIVVVMFVFLGTFFFKGSYHALMKLQEIMED
jgi:hypothetical protein